MNGNSRTAGKGNRKTDVCSGRSGKRSPRYMGQQKEVEPCPGKRREKIVSLQVFRATQKLPRKGLVHREILRHCLWFQVVPK